MHLQNLHHYLSLTVIILARKSHSNLYKIFISSMYFHHFVIISPWKRTGPLIWINLNSRHPKMICGKFGWTLTLWFWRRRFLNLVNVFFCYFGNITPRKRAWPFIWINLNLLHTRMTCAKFGWNWSSGSSEDKNVKRLRRRQHRRQISIRKVHLSLRLRWTKLYNIQVGAIYH